MTAAITWGTIGVFVLFLALGLAIGLIRGAKRSAVHFAFVIVSFVLAFFITTPIAGAILNIKFNLDGGSYTLSQYIIKMINFDLSNYGVAQEFITKLPVALVSPILFIVLSLVCYFVFDIIYLIVARLVFGKKKKDFENKKPHRIFGGAIGLVEGFLFMVLLFAPLTSLTSTVQDIAYVKTTAQAQAEEVSDDNHLKTIGSLASENLPPEVMDVLKAYNNSVLGKVTGAGGIDDLLFDGLSQVQVHGKTITIRKELLAGTKIYDNFVQIYNNFQDENFDVIKLSAIKQNLSTFLDGELFRTVVVDTAKQFILTHSEEQVKKLPEILQEILAELKNTLEGEEKISLADDLKNDLLKVVDAGDFILDKQLIQKYNELTEKDAMAILNFVNENLDTETFDRILGDVLDLKMVSYSMQALLNYGSDKVSEIFDGDKEIKLNTNVENVEEMLKQAKEAVGNLVELSNLLQLPQLLEAEDKVDFLVNIKTEDLEAGMTLAGTTLDELRDLEILKVKEGDDTNYVLDKILKHYNFSILGDTVYEMKDDTAEEVVISDYKTFFNHIKEPIMLVKENNLVALLDGGDVLDSVIDLLSADSGLLAKTILPFKNMTALDLGTMIYDEVVNTLKTQKLSGDDKLLNFDYLEIDGEETNAQNFARWNQAFNTLGETLKNLNTGSVSVGETTYTYIKYVLSAEYNQDTLIDSLLKDENFENILSPVFETELFQPLGQMFLDNIDSAVNGITKLSAKSTYKVDKTAAQALKALLGKVKALNGEDLDLKSVGQILDILKENAKADGVFNTVFCNFIWYLTGDNIGELSVDGQSPIDIKDKVAEYLKKEYTDEDLRAFYLEVSYTEKFKEIANAKQLGDNILKNLQSVPEIDSLETAQQFVDALESSLEGLSDQEVVDALNNLGDFVDKDTILGKFEGNDQVVKEALGSAFGGNETLQNAFKNFLWPEA